MSTRNPYEGTSGKLVLAFDVGTTFSGISYTILNPGEVPKISGVNRFPAQENVGGDSKIPSIMYYDRHGTVRAVGAEALHPSIADQAEEEGWRKVEWFKLHLRPKSVSSNLEGSKIPRLPRSKTVVSVFGDFLAYLFKCAKVYIQDTHAAGQVLWQSLEKDIHFVLSHPNGWGGSQQSKMRRSAIMAGLIPDTPEGRSRVQFVTEGEASLHFCIGSGLASSAIKENSTVIIADAGGGTIDVSSYRFDSVSPISVKETAPPECRLQGSVFVSRRAHAFIEALLRGSRFGSPEDVQNIAECFDRTAKRIFRDSEEPSYIKFGSPRDKDLKLGIRSGQLRLSGADVATLFEPSIANIVDAIQKLNPASEDAVPTVFLVGGFAASPWLFTQLQERLGATGLKLCRPDSHTNKAVADGAISFYLDHIVTTRAARFTVGARCNIEFNARDPEHRRREHTAYHNPSGTKRIPNGFDVIMVKMRCCSVISIVHFLMKYQNTQVSESKEFSRSYFRESNIASTFHSLVDDVCIYTGDSSDPKWTDEEPDMFSTLCTVHADTSQLAGTLQSRVGTTGKTYYRIVYKIVLLFGLTELAAQLSWVENGVEKRGPATVRYGEDLDAGEEEEDDDDVHGEEDDDVSEDMQHVGEKILKGHRD